jgi:hypothetical protein
MDARLPAWVGIVLAEVWFTAIRRVLPPPATTDHGTAGHGVALTG